MLTDDNLLLAGLVSAAALVLGFIFMAMNKKKTVLPLDDFKPFPLIRKTVLSHDSAEYVFGLPTPESVLGLPTGQHISLRYFETDKATGKKTQVQRAYTPVSDNTTLGEIILVVKVYRAGVHPKFPDGGKLSQHLDSLKIGDTIDIKGPKGHMEYLGNGGNYWIKPIGKPKQTKQCNQFIMIAGGTGITPMLQVANYMFRNNDDVKVNLLYANQSEYIFYRFGKSSEEKIESKSRKSISFSSWTLVEFLPLLLISSSRIISRIVYFCCPLNNRCMDLLFRSMKPESIIKQQLRKISCVVRNLKQW